MSIDLADLANRLEAAHDQLTAAYPDTYVSVAATWEAQPGTLRTMTFSSTNALDDDGDDTARVDPEEDERIATMG